MRTSSGSGRSTTTLLLVWLMLASVLVPMVSASDEAGEEESAIVAGDLSDFDPDTDGHAYIYNDEDRPVYSAFGYLKKQWIEDGFPNLVLPFSPSYQNTRSTARSCENAWAVDDTDTFTTSSGLVSATVEKISTNSAIFVEDGVVISSTALNDIASTWESTIYPTNTNYFGDPPDIDNNCQIEIILFQIDGGGGIGGYFDPNIASSREILFVDSGDMSWRNTILAHEFEHLLHNARDPYEYLWIDEGAADMAAYLCFGVTDTLSQHANEWSQNSNMSVRWWNQRIADYGGGFMFLMYLADKLGGGAAISSLVSDTATGGVGIENLARNPQAGSTAIGETMSDIFANFTAAVALDSAQGAFGFSNIAMTAGCVTGFICRAQMSGYRDEWQNTWTSPAQELEGWGMRAYKFAGGTGAPLNLMVQPTQFGVAGTVLAKDSSTGTWSMNRLRIDSGTGAGTGLVHGFGNTTDEVWVIAWYESQVTDCDYNFASCGITTGSYPTTDIVVQAGIITDPAEVDIMGITPFDRDSDNLDDSVEIELEVTSNAFFEIIEVTFEAFLNNTLRDSITFAVTAGNSIPTEESIWFTPPETGDWTFGVDIRDITGAVIDTAFALPIELGNMEPVATGSTSTAITQTWLPVSMFGGGFDVWGFGQLNQSYSHNETPVAYNWDLGDNSSSGLKNPVHIYTEAGNYTITLTVEDIGGFYSETQSWTLTVADTTEPIPEIRVDGVTITDEVVLLTNQRVLFSARSTVDNVPHEQMEFTWNWGDGSDEGGQGLVETSHSYVDGSADGIVYTLTLTVNDGTFVVEHQVYVRVLNRVPRQIFAEELQTYTLTPLEMPDVFTDDDGHIVEYLWTFDSGVNLSGRGMTLTSDFSASSSVSRNPTVGWMTPGLKSVTLEVTDDDGNMSSMTLMVRVLNQRPVAVFDRPSDGSVDTDYFFESMSFDPDGDTSLLQTRWNITGADSEIENISGVHYSFTEPGLYTVSLTVIDDRGAESATKSYQIRIANPLPVPMVEFMQPSANGSALHTIPNDGDEVTWWVPFVEDGGAFIAPNCPLKLDGSASYDADPRFVGRHSTDPDDAEWNGITRWIWDFGDATPQVEGPMVWHSWERPGTYVVTLTVVDGFEGGDTNTTSITVHISRAPEIEPIDPIDSDYVTQGDLVLLNHSAYDIDLIEGLEAWRDFDASDDSDGDGITTNDRDISLTSDLTISWDLNAMVDSDQDGDPRNDFLWGNMTWYQTGEIRIVLQVCDGVGVCASEDYIVTVLSAEEDNRQKSWDELTWKDFIPNKESAGLLSLVALVLVLGWLVMRQKDEDEIDAEEMLETYDVQEVEAEGGLPGMDQHTPPPQPKYLTVDERRNKESGYVRPIRTRRR
ncbi:MAG: PKD domain-containing protein [Candidatus Thalassarchaeaceae archaeon]|nr:PKD domain-containing protein [Candidatus Thalassarchaeaceae archaeon]